MYFRLFVFTCLIALPWVTKAQSALAVQDASGQYQAAQVASFVNFTDPSPIRAYKGSDNQWHKVQPIVPICGLDAKNSPLACNFLDARKLGAANGLASLDGSGHLPEEELGSIDNARVQGASLSSTVSAISAQILGRVSTGQDVLSALQATPVNSIEAFNPADSAFGRHYIISGGHSANDFVGEKHNCRTISGGDEGGACFQFINASGGSWTHRSGSGDMDGVNMEVDSYSSSPIDVIGGGTPSADGVNYQITFGSNFVKITPALSTKELALFRNRMSITTNIANGMSSVESNDYSGIDNVDMPNYYHGYVSNIENDSTSSTITIESYYYPGASFPGSIQAQYIWRTMANPSPYPYPGTQNWTQTTAQPTSSGSTTIILTGAISPPQAQNGQNACADWSCTLSNASLHSGTTVSSASYNSSNNTTTLNISAPTTAAISSGTTISFSVEDAKGGNSFAPGNMKGDQIDNQITYQSPVTNSAVKNSNFHSYTSPAIFLGQSVKDFNEYHLQADYQPKDGITRAHDNEYDFWMNGADHDGQLESRGLSLVWQGKHRLATGSWMMRLAGFNLQPTGLYVDGVTNGGLEFRSDTGLFAFKQTTQEAKNIGTVTPSMMMGSVGSSSHYGQLGWYASEDGPQNGSFHLGLLSSQTPSLAYNVDPLCRSTDVQHEEYACTQAGQLVFDPAGYMNGIALGIGQGVNFNPGLIVDSNANVTIPKTMTISQDARVQGTMVVGGKGGSIGIVSSDNKRTSYLTTDSNGNLFMVPDRANSGGGFRNYTFAYNNLPTAAQGTQFYCSDCYSQLRPASNTDLGLVVTWNGSQWIDGVGMRVQH
ncbi:hypothetical protein JK203_15315 [Gluconobacter cerinus]|uniref:hypothetical protein n=1 Tax=Gluconobacter cerinus TaxID=38307 RepID=UPI001B8C4169|nr:hypothetical protein [Gluconobacter cerinus]MBS1042189.1 hypothetical protein [Gluconobacter cerinus]